MTPRISIIIPVYNCEKSVDRCVRSVREQSLEEIEIILVNDGSTDGSLERCLSHQREDPRVKVVSQPNRGLSGARNTGLRNAAAPLVSFLDGDDYLSPDFCRDTLERMTGTGADMVVANFDYVTEEGEVLERSSPIVDEVRTGREALSWLQTPTYYYYVIACARLYKRSLFDAVSFPEGRLREDEFVAHELFAACTRVASMEKVLYHYVQHPGSIMSAPQIRTFDGLRAAAGRLAFYEEKGYSDLAGEMGPIFKRMYCYDRYQVKLRSLSDLREAHEIDRLYQECLRRTGYRQDGRDLLRRLFPDLCYAVMRLRLSLRRRRQVRGRRGEREQSFPKGE